MGRQADLLGIAVERGVVADGAVVGVVGLAGLGAGVWESEAELGGLWQLDRRFEPGLSEDERGGQRELWAKRLGAVRPGPARAR